MIKRTIIFFFMLLSAAGVQAQKTFTAADSAKFSVSWWHSKNLFDNLPDIRGEIIFLGNSITDGGEWFELLDNKKCLNRGISGDVTEGILMRLDGITRVKPARIFIMIGINDLSRNISVADIIANYRLILDRIVAETPGTKVYIESVLPVDEIKWKSKTLIGKTPLILELNAGLRLLAVEYGFEYVDVFSVMADEKNQLPAKYSLDGLHLTYEGYRVWADVVRPLVK